MDPSQPQNLRTQLGGRELDGSAPVLASWFVPSKASCFSGSLKHASRPGVPFRIYFNPTVSFTSDCRLVNAKKLLCVRAFCVRPII